MKKISVNGNEYSVKMNFFALMMFEKVSGHIYSGIETYGDSILLMYCMMKAANRNDDTEFSDFAESLTMDEYTGNTSVCTSLLVEFFSPNPGEEKKIKRRRKAAEHIRDFPNGRRRGRHHAIRSRRT